MSRKEQNQPRPAAARPKQGGRRRSHKPLAVMLAVLVLCGLAFAALDPSGMSDLARPDMLWRKLGRPLLRTVVFIAAGLFVGQLIENLGWTKKMGILAAPLVRAARLPAQSGLAFTASWASGVVANTFLANAWKDGKLTPRELIFSNLLNASLPAFFLHLPTTFFVVYALLGHIAVIYFSLALAAALLRFGGVILAARLSAAPGAGLHRDEPTQGTTAQKRLDWRELIEKFRARLWRMLLIILPVYVVIFLLGRGGFFNWLATSLARVVSSKVLPLEAMSVVVFAAVSEFTSGFAAAAAFLQSGGLDWRQVVVALLVGNILATPFRVIRHQLPHYMGIYQPALGSKLLLLGQGLRVASVLLVMLVFIWWCGLA